MTETAVVLAAGLGSRLERHTEACAKALVPVAGRPLIHHVLGSLAAAGLRRAVVVLGYHGAQVEASVGDGADFGLSVRYVWNPHYERGNAGSLWCALPEVAGQPFLLAMSDHLCSPSLLQTFLQQARGRSALAVDRSQLDPERTAEATKVVLNDGLVAGLGKQIAGWHALDTGISHWAAGAFDGVASTHWEGELAALMAHLARLRRVAACDVSGHFWLDVDTGDDLRLAEQLLQADARNLG